MSDWVTDLGLIFGSVVVLVAGLWLGAGSRDLFGGLFPRRSGPDWPVGVQEDDAPHFAVRHLDGLRPAANAGQRDTELVDLGSRRLGSRRA